MSIRRAHRVSQSDQREQIVAKRNADVVVLTPVKRWLVGIGRLEPGVIFLREDLVKGPRSWVGWAKGTVGDEHLPNRSVVG